MPDQFKQQTFHSANMVQFAQQDHCLLTCMDVHRTSLGAANEAALARSSVNLHTFPAIATAPHAVRVPQMWKSFQDVGLGSSSR